MNHTEIKAEIEKKKAELFDLNRQLKQAEKKWEATFPSDLYGICGDGITLNNFFRTPGAHYIKTGMAYRNAKAAEYARDNYLIPTMLQAQYIAEHIETMKPGWVADRNDPEQAKYAALYSIDKGKYILLPPIHCYYSGVPVGPENVIERMVEDLNSGRFTLYPEAGE